MSLPRGHVAAQAGMAFALGAGWFVLLSLLVSTGWFSSRAVLAVTVVVLDVAVVWVLARYLGIGYGVAVGVAGVVALDWYCIPPIHAARVPDTENALALGAYLVTGALLGHLASSARRRAEESEQEVRVLAQEQAALRRVATLVAEESPPDQVFGSVTEEVGRLLDLDLTTLLRYESDGSVTTLAVWSRDGRNLALGSRWRLAPGTVAARVWATGEAQRLDDYAAAEGPLAEELGTLGVRSSAGSPVIVGGALWGVMVGASRSGEPIARGTEQRLGEFTQLAGTAVANAESRGELTASRARIVASSDEARQRIERDLHDGVQQRLVSLALDVRRAESLAEPEQRTLIDELSGLREGLVGVVDELREVSHGIHPAILTEGGLRPALSALARRAPLPVELDVRGDDRPPEAVEVCVYYVVSEALTNVIKHAEATYVAVGLEVGPDVVTLGVSDDGLGGADHRTGSGLVGMADRVHALGGTIEIRSPEGTGTRLAVRIPVTVETSG